MPSAARRRSTACGGLARHGRGDRRRLPAARSGFTPVDGPIRNRQSGRDGLPGQHAAPSSARNTLDQGGHRATPDESASSTVGLQRRAWGQQRAERCSSRAFACGRIGQRSPARRRCRPAARAPHRRAPQMPSPLCRRQEGPGAALRRVRARGSPRRHPSALDVLALRRAGARRPKANARQQEAFALWHFLPSLCRGGFSGAAVRQMMRGAAPRPVAGPTSGDRRRPSCRRHRP
jgi:hypothetical protein